MSTRSSPSQDALRRKREQIVRAHEAAENAGDVEATLATFLRPRYDIAPAGVFDGAGAVRELLAGIFRAIPDFHSRATRIHHADDAVIVESETTGTHRGGELFGIPPRGRRMRMRAVSIYAFEGEHMVCETMYFDAATLRAQLGADDGG
jgi:steroid delta-isomerase-like uncharacterized protein